MAKAVPESSSREDTSLPDFEGDLGLDPRTLRSIEMEEAWNRQHEQDEAERPFHNQDVVLAVGIKGAFHVAKVEAVDKMDTDKWRVRFGIPGGHTLMYGVSTAKDPDDETRPFPGHESKLLVAIDNPEQVLAFRQRLEPKKQTPYEEAGEPLTVSARWKEELQELGWGITPFEDEVERRGLTFASDEERAEAELAHEARTLDSRVVEILEALPTVQIEAPPKAIHLDLAP